MREERGVWEEREIEREVGVWSDQYGRKEREGRGKRRESGETERERERAKGEGERG